MMHSRLLVPVALVAASIAGAACGNTGPRHEIRGVSEGMRISASAESLPPRAQETTTWRIQVTDIKTGRPIEGGIGSIWFRQKRVPGQDVHEGSNGLVPAKELGVYVGTTSIVMAGEWQIGVVFYKDSTAPRATMDWIQEVRAPKPIGG